MVDFGEFVNMMINQNNNTLDQEELLEAFRTFDGDDKGYIFSNEIRYVMRHMGETIPEQDINEILQDHQDSRKRKITFEGKDAFAMRANVFSRVCYACYILCCPILLHRICETCQTGSLKFASISAEWIYSSSDLCANCRERSYVIVQTTLRNL